jgi:predicted outer membrane protein
VAFDMAYIQAQVRVHEMVLEMLEERLLIPDADQMALEEELKTVRTAVQTHLRHAERVERELEEDAPDGG